MRLIPVIFLAALCALPGRGFAAAAGDNGQTDRSPDLYKKAADYYYRISGAAGPAGKEEWLKCIELFREVYTFHPTGEKSPEALYMTGKIYKELYHRFNTDAYRDNAVSIFRVLAKSHSHSTLADDALYLSGELYREEGDIPHALSAYRGVTAWFPEGDMVTRARQRIEELKPLQEKAEKEGHQTFASLKAVRFYSGDDYARLVFDLSKLVNYRIIRGDDDRGLTIDLLGARLGDHKGKDMKREDGMISHIQVVQVEDGLSRIYLTLTTPHRFSSMELDNPDRIVVDIYGQAEEDVITLTETDNTGVDTAASAATAAAETAAGAAAATVGALGAAAETAGEAASEAGEITVEAATGEEEKAVIEPVKTDSGPLEKLEVKAIKVVDKQLPTGKDSYDAVKVAVVKPTAKSAKTLEAKNVKLQKKVLTTASAKTKVAGKKSSSGRPDPVFIEAGLSLPSETGRSSGKRPSPEPAKKASPGRDRGYDIKTIVIDAGHGGRDPGAVSRAGLKEKDVTLDIALRLRNRLKHECGCRIVMTRATDVYIPLEKRTAIANSVNADLFISVHVNAAENRRANGVETYYLSPARSKRAMYTAARENMIKESKGNQGMDDINFIFSDMQNTNKINESSAMAKNVQDNLVGTLRDNYRTKDLGVKSAMFYVLHGARMPSILVETAFISNAAEEKRLRTSAFRERVAKGIADGVSKYARSDRLAMAR